MSQKDNSDDDAPQTQHVNIAAGNEEPITLLLRTLADLKGVDVTDLSPLYSCINQIVDDLFDTPPPGEADAVLLFTYEGFRITLYQDGLAVLRVPPHQRRAPSENGTTR